LYTLGLLAPRHEAPRGKRDPRYRTVVLKVTMPGNMACAAMPRFRSTACPQRSGTSPQRRPTFPRQASGVSRATRCSGAASNRTTRSCVLGLTAASSRRNVDQSLATPRRIAREAAGRQVRTSAEDDHRAGSGGLIGSSSQLPDRGPVSPKTWLRYLQQPRRRGGSCSASPAPEPFHGPARIPAIGLPVA
jgi:hypothetical protein